MNTSVRLLVTGASGFVGSRLVNRLSCSGGSVTAFSRSPGSGSLACPHVFFDLSDVVDLRELIHGHDVVIHCAARVHVMNDTSADPLTEFRKVNVDGTLNLARQSADAGVRRFIFISSIKVNGESSLPGQPFRADDLPAPHDPYGVSKREAEDGLRALAAETGMEVVVIRPALVYGPGVKANFRSMMRWLNKGIPLPLGSIHNKRSLVALDNLIDLIVTCIDHPAAANQTFLVSDGEDLSTSEMLLRMGEALDKPARLLPVPAWILKSVAMLLGRQGVAQRLCGSLQVDISKTRTMLGWSPPFSGTAAMRVTAEAFKAEQVLSTVR
ncbi:UDP-glucose 4-epimerase family protein [Ectopseudomonas khazarica]|uniref:UDP-glucose 4-epimerase family protein n=1 Tax=Ectopseudomonas khazarica TaxID=2502979 RepID=UPI0037C98EE3